MRSRKAIRGRNRRTRFPWICRAAAELGVTRNHLYFVLVGERKSPRCKAGYARIRSEMEGRAA